MESNKQDTVIGTKFRDENFSWDRLIREGLSLWEEFSKPKGWSADSIVDESNQKEIMWEDPEELTDSEKPSEDLYDQKNWEKQRETSNEAEGQAEVIP